MEYNDIHTDRKRGILQILKGMMVVILAFTAVFFNAAGLRVHAAGDDDYIEISTADELMNMSPDGNYRLIADIDLSGAEWKPIVFSGHFDGNSFSILNASVKQTGSFVRKTYDGNMKEYDTSFAGFFEVLEDGAEVKNLKLINMRVDVETDKPCFAAGIAGYMEKSSLINCSVQGIISLRAHEKMFGVGGILGYGCGSIERCSADVTLVCTDTDADTKDEQYMGGACAAGYPDINDCEIKIAGFDSDHGYVHDGGLVGMYIFYPAGIDYHGSITGNHVTGKIRFFEDNTNRRAYCKGFIGEIMIWEFDNDRNDTDDFERDEIFSYDKDIKPHECDAPNMEESVTAPSCDFGYTTYTCSNCGYSETDHYTLKSHSFEWTINKEATIDEEGFKTGVCSVCGVTAEAVIPKLELPEGVTLLEPEEEPLPIVVEEVTETPVEDTDDKADKKGGAGIIIAAVLILGGAAAGAFVYLKKRR